MVIGNCGSVIMQKIFALLIPILLLSGCLSSGESISEETYTPQIRESAHENHSNQFWNVAPMSMGNTSIVSFNGTGELNFTLELTAQFHEPAHWDRGYVNYSLIYENETVFSVQINNEIEKYYTHQINNMSGNITLQIQASGSDSQTDNKPGDYFISNAYFTHKY